MRKQPDALFVVDLRKEALAMIREGAHLGIPVIALVDTNCDPDEADYVIPGNDDAIRACSLVIRVIADGIEAGRQKVTPQELRRDGARAAEEQPEVAQEEPPPADATPPEYEQLAEKEAVVEPRRRAR